MLMNMALINYQRMFRFFTCFALTYFIKFHVDSLVFMSRGLFVTFCLVSIVFSLLLREASSFRPSIDVGFARLSNFVSKTPTILRTRLSTTRHILRARMSSASNPHNFSWQQTMLRIKDPKLSVPFYEKHFGFKLIHTYRFDQWGFSLYFLATVPEGTVLPTPGTPESAAYLWSMRGTCLELTHNHGSETDASFKVQKHILTCIYMYEINYDTSCAWNHFRSITAMWSRTADLVILL